MHIERARLALIAVTPDLAEQLLARLDLARGTQQLCKQRKLLDGQRQLFAVHSALVRRGIHPYPVRLEHLFLCVFTQVGIDARGQFHHRKRLGHIVVRSIIQSADDVGFRRLCRQHDHRYFFGTRVVFELFQCRHAVHPRQHHVHQNEIGRAPFFELCEQIFRAVEQLDVIAESAERKPQQILQVLVVLDRPDQTHRCLT